MEPCLDRAQFDRCWEWLANAVACDIGGRPSHTKEEVWSLIQSGDAFFFPGKGCANLSNFAEVPAFKAINFWATGGDLKEMTQVLRPAVEQWAKAHGCSISTFSTPREGFARVMEPFGYRKTHITITKDLTA